MGLLARECAAMSLSGGRVFATGNSISRCPDGDAWRSFEWLAPFKVGAEDGGGLRGVWPAWANRVRSTALQFHLNRLLTACVVGLASTSHIVSVGHSGKHGLPRHCSQLCAPPRSCVPTAVYRVLQRCRVCGGRICGIVFTNCRCVLLLRWPCGVPKMTQSFWVNQLTIIY